MARDVEIKIDERQVRLIGGDPPTRKEIQRAGYQVAKYAATTGGAPRRTGRGANSIRGTVSTEDPTAADVSWSQKYYYMIFQEGGWRPGGKGTRVPGKFFLRRAFENYRHY